MRDRFISFPHVHMKRTKLLLSISTIATLLSPAAMYAATSMHEAENDPTLTTQSTMPTDEFLRLFTTPASGDDAEGFIFDQTAFRAHPCFNAVGAEVDYCLQLFGVTTDFSAEVGSDIDTDESTDDTDDDDNADDMEIHEQTVIEHNESVTSEDESGSLRDRVLERSQRLWALCMNDELGQPGCYQNFIRLVTSEDMTLSAIEELFGLNSNDDEEDEEDMNDEENDENMNDEEDDDDVQSATDSDTADLSRQEKAQWLWDVCGNSAEGQQGCYRRHYRTAIDEETDMTELEQDIR
jgi:hypothetical protein